MSYDTLYFALFFAGVWLAFVIAPWRGWVLLASSIIFYSVAGLRDSPMAAVRPSGSSAVRRLDAPTPADRPRSRPVSSRPGQKDCLCGFDSTAGGRCVSRRARERCGRVVRALAVHVPDLFRLLRLLRHR